MFRKFQIFYNDKLKMNLQEWDYGHAYRKSCKHFISCAYCIVFIIIIIEFVLNVSIHLDLPFKLIHSLIIIMFLPPVASMLVNKKIVWWRFGFACDQFASICRL